MTIILTSPTFESTLQGGPGTYFPTGMTGTLRVRVDDGQGNTVYGPTASAIVEVGEAIYVATIPAPTEAGQYVVIWDDGAGHEVADEDVLEVVGPGEDDDAEIQHWAPTVQEVANVTPSYTRGGWDDDEDQAGAELGTYTSDTTPTADEVSAMILLACREIRGRVGVTIPERCWTLARTTAVWHVAAAISGGKLPAQTEDSRGEYQGHVARYLASLEELVSQARQPWALRLC